MNINDDKSAIIKYSVELYPEIHLEKYKGLTAVKLPVQVEEGSIDSEIAAVRLRNARIQTVSRPAINGDNVVIDFEGLVDGAPFEGGKGENYELVLGSNTFIPGFEEKINGMTAGDERSLDLTFPEDYHKKELAGKPVVFKVKLKEVKEKILPELDDEFAKDVSEFDTLEEYRESIRQKLMTAKKEESDKAFEEAVLGKLADSYECDLPEVMIENYISNQMEGLKQQLAQYGMELDMYLNLLGTNAEDYRANMRPNAVRQIKTTLALEKIAELEKLEPAEDEIEAYYEEMASRYGVDIKVAKESIPIESVKDELNLRAASKFVCDNAVAEEPAADKAEHDAKEKKAKKAKKAKTAVKEAAEPAETVETVTEEKKTKNKSASKKAAETAEKEENPA
jgi:trigger factor